jgi:hypothetical protein
VYALQGVYVFYADRRVVCDVVASQDFDVGTIRSYCDCPGFCRIATGKLRASLPSRDDDTLKIGAGHTPIDQLPRHQYTPAYLTHPRKHGPILRCPRSRQSRLALRTSSADPVGEVGMTGRGAMNVANTHRYNSSQWQLSDLSSAV